MPDRCGRGGKGGRERERESGRGGETEREAAAAGERDGRRETADDREMAPVRTRLRAVEGEKCQSPIACTQNRSKMQPSNAKDYLNSTTLHFVHLSMP